MFVAHRIVVFVLYEITDVVVGCIFIRKVKTPKQPCMRSDLSAGVNTINNNTNSQMCDSQLCQLVCCVCKFVKKKTETMENFISDLSVFNVILMLG